MAEELRQGRWVRAVGAVSGGADGAGAADLGRTTKMGMGNRAALTGLLLFVLPLCPLTSPVSECEAFWEASAHTGYDSNVNLSVDDVEGDAYFGGSLAFQREPPHESRFDWTFVASLEGSQYAETDDLSYATLGLAPGLAYVPHYLWTIRLSPFVQAKAVRDTDQTALSFGISGSLEERIGSRWYAGQTYVHTVSRAEAEAYSYSEHLFGLFLGAHWTERISNEIGYAYSHGDSFRTVGTDSGGGLVGRGRHRRYSETFGSDVVREKVDRHTAGVRFGVDWTRSLFCRFSYEFAVLEGDLGSAESHNAFFATGLRF